MGPWVLRHAALGVASEHKINDIIATFFQMGEMLLGQESKEMWALSCHDCGKEVDCTTSLARAMDHARACAYLDIEEEIQV